MSSIEKDCDDNEEEGNENGSGKMSVFTVAADVHEDPDDNIEQRNSVRVAKESGPNIEKSHSSLSLPEIQDLDIIQVAPVHVQKPKVPVQEVPVLETSSGLTISPSSSRKIKLQPNFESIEMNELKMKQLSAAQRSLQTNLFLITIFTIIFLSVILLPKREFYTLITFSIMKGSMPIFTTMAKFGTVQMVFSQYKSIVVDKFASTVILTRQNLLT